MAKTSPLPKAKTRREIAQLLKKMKLGSEFHVRDNSERVAVNQIAAVIKDLDMLNGITVKTRQAESGGYAVTAEAEKQ